MSRKRITFADHLRQFVLECGITRYRISKDTGIDEATLSRFLNHKGLPIGSEVERVGRVFRFGTSKEAEMTEQPLLLSVESRREVVRLFAKSRLASVRRGENAQAGKMWTLKMLVVAS